ncbi:MAG TPA: hypothetical protein VJI74_03870 [Candidatus Paceibacterota bacterium]
MILALGIAVISATVGATIFFGASGIEDKVNGIGWLAFGIYDLMLADGFERIIEKHR